MSSKLRKILSLALSLSLLFQQVGFAQIATELNIASHFSRMASNLTIEKFRPLHLRYFSYDSLNSNFKVLLDKGDIKALADKELQSSTQTLLNYFLVGVSLPDSSFWVNLRPDSEDNIIDEYLSKTDVGKIMLEADLQLKKDTSSMTSPSTPEGKEYWDKLYKKAANLYGNDNITIPTLTRPWIVPSEIIVRESSDSAYIYKATLKVMLEQDYLKDSSTYNFQDTRAKALNEYSSQLIRELIIPKLTKEVNSSKRYAPLRQVYYSLILSRWFKQKFNGKSGTYASLINTKDLTNLISTTSWSKTDYFNQYKKSFSDGEYSIKEPVYTPTGQTIRSYFSGGLDLKGAGINNPSGFTSSPINPSVLKTGVLMEGDKLSGGVKIFAASPIEISQKPDKEQVSHLLKQRRLAELSLLFYRSGLTYEYVEQLVKNIRPGILQYPVEPDSILKPNSRNVFYLKEQVSITKDLYINKVVISYFKGGFIIRFDTLTDYIQVTISNSPQGLKINSNTFSDSMYLPETRGLRDKLRGILEKLNSDSAASPIKVIEQKSRTWSGFNTLKVNESSHVTIKPEGQKKEIPVIGVGYRKDEILSPSEYRLTQKITQEIYIIEVGSREADKEVVFNLINSGDGSTISGYINGKLSGVGYIRNIDVKKAIETLSVKVIDKDKKVEIYSNDLFNYWKACKEKGFIKDTTVKIIEGYTVEFKPVSAASPSLSPDEVSPYRSKASSAIAEKISQDPQALLDLYSKILRIKDSFEVIFGVGFGKDRLRFSNIEVVNKVGAELQRNGLSFAEAVYALNGDNPQALLYLSSNTSSWKIDGICSFKKGSIFDLEIDKHFEDAMVKAVLNDSLLKEKEQMQIIAWYLIKDVERKAKDYLHGDSSMSDEASIKYAKSIINKRGLADLMDNILNAELKMIIQRIVSAYGEDSKKQLVQACEDATSASWNNFMTPRTHYIRTRVGIQEVLERAAGIAPASSPVQSIKGLTVDSTKLEKLQSLDSNYLNGVDPLVRNCYVDSSNIRLLFLDDQPHLYTLKLYYYEPNGQTYLLIIPNEQYAPHSDHYSVYLGTDLTKQQLHRVNNILSSLNHIGPTYPHTKSYTKDGLSEIMMGMLRNDNNNPDTGLDQWLPESLVFDPIEDNMVRIYEFRNTAILPVQAFRDSTELKYGLREAINNSKIIPGEVKGLYNRRLSYAMNLFDSYPMDSILAALSTLGVAANRYQLGSGYKKIEGIIKGLIANDQRITRKQEAEVIAKKLIIFLEIGFKGEGGQPRELELKFKELGEVIRIFLKEKSSATPPASSPVINSNGKNGNGSIIFVHSDRAMEVVDILSVLLRENNYDEVIKQGDNILKANQVVENPLVRFQLMRLCNLVGKAYLERPKHDEADRKNDYTHSWRIFSEALRWFSRIEEDKSIKVNEGSLGSERREAFYGKYYALGLAILLRDSNKYLSLATAKASFKKSHNVMPGQEASRKLLDLLLTKHNEVKSKSQNAFGSGILDGMLLKLDYMLVVVEEALKAAPNDAGFKKSKEYIENEITALKKRLLAMRPHPASSEKEYNELVLMKSVEWQADTKVYANVFRAYYSVGDKTKKDALLKSLLASIERKLAVAKAVKDDSGNVINKIEGNVKIEVKGSGNEVVLRIWKVNPSEVIDLYSLGEQIISTDVKKTKVESTSSPLDPHNDLLGNITSLGSKVKELQDSSKILDAKVQALEDVFDELQMQIRSLRNAILNGRGKTGSVDSSLEEIIEVLDRVIRWDETGIYEYASRVVDPNNNRVTSDDLLAAYSETITSLIGSIEGLRSKIEAIVTRSSSNVAVSLPDVASSPMRASTRTRSRHIAREPKSYPQSQKADWTFQAAIEDKNVSEILKSVPVEISWVNGKARLALTLHKLPKEKRMSFSTDFMASINMDGNDIDNWVTIASPTPRNTPAQGFGHAIFKDSGMKDALALRISRNSNGKPHLEIRVTEKAMQEMENKGLAYNGEFDDNFGGGFKSTWEFVTKFSSSSSPMTELEIRSAVIEMRRGGADGVLVSSVYEHLGKEAYMITEGEKRQIEAVLNQMVEDDILQRPYPGRWFFNSSSSPVIDQAPKKTGGIDFRVLPMNIQPMGSFKGLNFSLPQLTQSQLAQINIESEIKDIQNMINSGIRPSGQRVKELLAACNQKKEMSAKADKLLLCLINICKLEEENAYEATPELREALVIVDAVS